VISFCCAALFLLLPGHALVVFCINEQELSLTFRLFLRLIAGAVTASFVALALACAGMFSLLMCGVLLGTLTLAAAIGSRCRGRALLPSAHLVRATALATGVAAVVLLLIKPHEYIFGGWDPGVYMQTGAAIARTGGINHDDPLLASLPPSEQDLVTRRRGRVERFPGFHVVDPARGRISPQFYHLYSCWIAMAYSLGGVEAALRLNILFGLMALFAFALTAHALVGQRAGYMALLLLLLNPAQIWLLRFPTAEIVAQCFVWSALLMWCLYVKNESASHGILGAACVTAAMLTRLPSVMLLPPLALFLLHRAVTQSGRRDAWPVVVLAIGVAATVLMNRAIAATYIDFIAWTRWFIRRNAIPAWSALFLLGVWVGALRFRPQQTAWFMTSRWVRSALGVGVAGLAIYALVFRLQVVSGGRAAQILHGDALRRHLHDAATFRHFAVVLSSPGLVLAVAGALYMAWRGLTRERSLFWMVAMTAAVVLFDHKRIEPFYMFALRRFIPVVLPAMCLFAGYALDRLTCRLHKSRRLLVTVAALLLLLGLPLARGRNVATQRDFAGLASFCNQLAERIPDGPSTVVVSDWHWFGAPLHYLYGRPTVVLYKKEPTALHTITQRMLTWLREGKEVYYLAREATPCAATLDFTHLGTFELESGRLEHAQTPFPRTYVPRNATVHLFRTSRIDATTRIEGPYTLSLGEACFGLGPGLGATITREDFAQLRWTTDRGTIALDPSHTSGPVVLSLSLANARPKRLGNTPLTISLNGSVLDTLEIPTDATFRTYRVPVPPGLAATCRDAALTVQLECDTWSPQQEGLSSDPRRLGVMLQRVALLAGANGPELTGRGMGPESDRHLAGFHPADPDTSTPSTRRTLRVLEGEAHLVMPWPRTESPVRLRVVTECDGDPGAGSRLHVSLAGGKVGDIQLDSGRAEHEIVVPPALARLATANRADLAMRVVGNAVDARVMLERVAWEIE